MRLDSALKKSSMPTGFFIWGYMYPFTFIFGGAMYPLTLHLGVQRINRIGRSINHIISLKICKERSDWIILPKLTNQQLYYTYFEVNCKQKVFLYSARNGFSTCTHVGFFQLYVHDFYST